MEKPTITQQIKALFSLVGGVAGISALILIGVREGVNTQRLSGLDYRVLRLENGGSSHAQQSVIKAEGLAKELGHEMLDRKEQDEVLRREIDAAVLNLTKRMDGLALSLSKSIEQNTELIMLLKLQQGKDSK